MKINKKILKFFQNKGISKTEIAESYGGTSQNVWNILNKESGKVPLDFLIWLAENYPEIDINELLKESSDDYMVKEPQTIYLQRPATKEEILIEVSKVLDKLL